MNIKISYLDKFDCVFILDIFWLRYISMLLRLFVTFENAGTLVITCIDNIPAVLLGST